MGGWGGGEVGGGEGFLPVEQPESFLTNNLQLTH